MEEQLFNEIRDQFCNSNTQVVAGKMMSSEAITYQGKVFAFLSSKQRMVFRLGKSFNPELHHFEIEVFNPFKKRAPLWAWFEVPFSHKEQWEQLTHQALSTLKREL